MHSPISFQKNDFAQVAKKLNFSSDFSISPLKGGLINALFMMRDKNQSLVVRIYVRKKPVADIRYEIGAMNFLRSNGIPTPFVHSAQENSVFTIKGFKAIILDRVPGKNSSVRLLTKSMVHSMAKTIGLLHKVGKQFPNKKKRIEWDLYNFTYDHEFLEKYGEKIKALPAGKKWFSFFYRETVRLEKITKKNIDSTQTFIHNDLRVDNFLFNRGSVTGLLDFDECMFGSPSSDIGTIYGQIPARFRQSFTKKYEQESGLRVDKKKIQILGLHYKLLLLKWAFSQYFKSQKSGDWETYEGYVNQYLVYRLNGDKSFPRSINLPYVKG